MIQNGQFKVLKKYFEKKNFIGFCESKIFQSIEEIAGSDVRKKVENHGLNKLHKYFSVDYIPFLQFSLEEKLRDILIQSIYNVGKNDLNYDNFFIDRELNFRIVYPYEVSIKSKLTRSVYRLINLKNYKKAQTEIDDAIKNSKNYIPEYSDIKKIEYFKNLPVPCYGHSPHRDTWFGHTYGALNLWWSISGVNSETGLTMYPEVNNYDLKHTEEPMYVEDDNYLGKPTILDMQDGDLLVFDPEILHGTKLITKSDNTRIVVSGRLNKNKPTFYKMTKAYEYPDWYSSIDFDNNITDKIHKFLRKDHSINSPDKNYKKNDFEIITIKINENIKFKNKYKIINKNLINKNCRYKIVFKNYNVSFLVTENKFFCFKTECPHLGFDMTTAYFDEKKKEIICNGHAASFNEKGESGCKILKLKTFEIAQEQDSIYLKT